MQHYEYRQVFNSLLLDEVNPLAINAFYTLTEKIKREGGKNKADIEKAQAMARSIGTNLYVSIFTDVITLNTEFLKSAIGDASHIDFARNIAYLSHQGKTFRNNHDSRMVKIDRYGIEHALSSKAGIVQSLAIICLDKVIGKMKYIRSEENKKKNQSERKALISKFHVYSVRIVYDNKTHEVGIKLADYGDSVRLHEVFKFATVY